MADFIERVKLIKEVRRLSTHYLNEWDTLGVLAAIDRIPAADVRPVVFCRDCTFFKPQQKSKRWSSTTPMCSRSATIKMPPDGFCSFGVKREEN